MYKSMIVTPDYDCIEINIEKQKLFLYKNGKTIIDTPCITGTKGVNDTPCGTFHIYYICHNVSMQKKNYGDEYHTHHAFFFAPWGAGYGIHDALWKEDESYKPDTYLTDGSSGCVEVPLEVSEKLSREVYPGMPVVINEK